jgi:hypothetical protein
MTKKIKYSGLFMAAAIFMASCGGGSIESDAKKVADLQCKAQKLIEKAADGDMAVIEESTKLTKEAADLTRELEGKYSSDSDKKKFAEALIKASGDCK